MGYSGEFYLFMWARKLEGNSEKSVLKDIRDNSILSAVTSNLVAVVLVALIIYSGQVEISELLGEDRKSTRLNSSHVATSYAVFCLKNKSIECYRLSTVAYDQ